MRSTAVVLATLASLAAAASARSEGIAVTPNLNVPSGFGADVTYRLSPHFNLRAGASVPSTPEVKDVKFEDIKYDVKLKLGGFDLLADWHPFAGNFHVSGGIVTLRTPWALKATSVSSYKINGTSYDASGVGSLTGEIRFGNTVAPALLVGWGNPVRPGKRFGVVLDAGLAYIGKQEFALTATGPLTTDAAFQRDLEAEQRKQSYEHSLTLVVKVGLSYQF
jgi:hypothetical protein